MKKILDYVMKYKYIIILIIIIFITVFYFLVNNISNNNNSNNIKEMKYDEFHQLLREQRTFVVFYETNDEQSKKTKEYLLKNNVEFYLVNNKFYNKTEIKEFLEISKIDKKASKHPAIIYIQEGIIFANLINIENIKSVREFSEQYDLKVLTHFE